MVAIGISEFTFGFAFLHELTKANWSDVTAAPILPSLQEEHDEGWDAKLPLAGTPFFYQFKLVEYLSRSNATYIKNGTYNGPYYRIALHDRDNNRQHRLLWQLGQGNPETFYAAPELNKRSSFNDQFLNQQIVPSSRLIRLSDCEQLADTDGESHVITFQQNQPAWIFHSEPRRREQSYSG
jgi:ribosomal protein S16